MCHIDKSHPMKTRKKPATSHPYMTFRLVSTVQEDLTVYVRVDGALRENTHAIIKRS